MTKRKRTNNDPQNIHIKNKNRVTGTPQKTGGELGCSGRVSSARRSEEKINSSQLPRTYSSR